jgi:hypothetical protein
LFQKGKVYIDGVGTYPATTQDTATWLGFSLTITTGWVASGTVMASVFTAPQQAGPDLSLEITYEHTPQRLAKSTPESNHPQGDTVGV